MRVCSCVTLPSQVHRRQTSSTSSSRSGRATLVSSVKTRHISWSSSQGGHWSKVCACVHVFVLALHSHHKTSHLWTLAQDIILEWEQRKKRRFGGGAPCESRKTVFCVPCPVASDSCHDQASAWLLDVAETEQSSNVAGVRVLNCFLCCVSPGMLAQQSFPNSEGRRRRTALQKLSGSFASQLNLATIRMDMCLLSV